MNTKTRIAKRKKTGRRQKKSGADVNSLVFKIDAQRWLAHNNEPLL